MRNSAELTDLYFYIVKLPLTKVTGYITVRLTKVTELGLYYCKTH